MSKRPSIYGVEHPDGDTVYVPTLREAREGVKLFGGGTIVRYRLADLPLRELACALLANRAWTDSEQTVK